MKISQFMALKYRSWLGTGTKCGGVISVKGIPTIPL